MGVINKKPVNSIKYPMIWKLFDGLGFCIKWVMLKVERSLFDEISNVPINIKLKAIIAYIPKCIAGFFCGSEVNRLIRKNVENNKMPKKDMNRNRSNAIKIPIIPKSNIMSNI